MCRGFELILICMIALIILKLFCDMLLFPFKKYSWEWRLLSFSHLIKTVMYKTQCYVLLFMFSVNSSATSPPHPLIHSQPYSVSYKLHLFYSICWLASGWSGQWITLPGGGRAEKKLACLPSCLLQHTNCMFLYNSANAARPLLHSCGASWAPVGLFLSGPLALGIVTVSFCCSSLAPPIPLFVPLPTTLHLVASWKIHMGEVFFLWGLPWLSFIRRFNKSFDRNIN